MDKYIIRTSDRKDYKKCRQYWDFNSKIRQNWEPNKVPQPLRFGIAVHKGLEVWHAVETWEWTKDDRASVLEGLAVAAFYKAYPKPTDATGGVITDPTLVAEWQAESELGAAMLRNYFAQSKGKESYTPKLVEAEFEVPIVVSVDMIASVANHPGFTVEKLTYGENVFPCLHYKGIPVYYQGRIDMIVEDQYENYYIVDWKTAAKFDPLDWLDIEEQITSYCWAFQLILGIRVSGFIYSELFKGAPGEPEVLKSGKLSKNKQQNVTEKTYREAIDRLNLPMADYEDFLKYLATNERQYFRRERVQRSQKELELAGRRIVLEAMEMIDENTAIYPNPSKLCNNCSYRGPCVLVNEGGDAEYVLSAGFHKRVSNDG